MSKTKKTLQIFGILFLVLAGLSLLLALLMYFYPGFAEKYIASRGEEMGDLHGKDPVSLYASSYLMEAVIYGIFYFLVRRLAEGKSKGLILLILLAVSVVGSAISLIASSFNVVLLISLLVDACILILVIKVRKEIKGEPPETDEKSEKALEEGN